MQTHEVSELLRRSAAEFLGGQQPARRDVPAGVIPGFDQAAWREMAGLGWIGLGLSEPGSEAAVGLREATVLCEQFGRIAWSAPYVASSVLPSAILAGCAVDPHVQDLVRTCVTGERQFAAAWQEESRQCDAALPSTQFIDGRLSGAKCFVVAARSDSILLVTASLAGASVLLAIEASAPGVTLERYAAGSGSEATVRFDHAPVLFNRPIASGEAAQEALANALRSARIALCAQLAGLAGGLLERTLAYVGNRVQFTRPIASFQSIRHRCVDLYIATRLASATWHHALQCFESAPQAASTAAAISAAKARCGDVAVQVGRESVQMHGAMGFTEAGGVGVYLREALHGRAWLGTPLAHRRRFMQRTTAARDATAEVRDA